MRKRKKKVEKYPELKYETKPVKKGRKIQWHVIESPSKNVVGKFDFKDDADHIVKFHNKNQGDLTIFISLGEASTSVK